MSAFQPDHPVATVRPSPNFGERRGGLRPEILLMHYTGMASGEAAEDWLCDPRSEVSCHYVVHEDGRVVQLVREADRAWHAGKSVWRGVEDINSQSIGIEVVNPGHTLGYRRFPERQIDAVIALSKGIIARHGIAADMVLAHSDIAPGRKVDPGELFPWRRLAAAGVGLHVPASRSRKGATLDVGAMGQAVEKLQRDLAACGYGIEPAGVYDERTKIVVSAFQRHFRTRLVDGRADPSTRATLKRLLDRLGEGTQV